MKLDTTPHIVNIDGERVQVMQADNGRLYATDSHGREWNALTLEILEFRIARTFKIYKDES